MPSESEVRSAVGYFKDGRFVDGNMQILLSLAERYLAQEGKMVEKIRHASGCSTKKNYTSCLPCICGAEGWNSAIDAMRLASVVSEEGLTEIINKEPFPLEGKKWEYSKKLAHAIASYVNGGNVIGGER